jgi:hypothetical protein
MDPDDPSDREPTPLQREVWFEIYREERPVVELARALRPMAELLEIPSWLNSPYDTAIKGLLRLSEQAWSAVEDGEVSPYGAAAIGNGLADVADAAARADRQMMMIADLARQERIVSERLWSEPVWPVHVALSWIAFRDKTRLCMISGLSVEALKVKSDDDHSPQSFLLGALRSGKLRATLSGVYRASATYWREKPELERDSSFWRDDVVQLWQEGPTSRLKHRVLITFPQNAEASASIDPQTESKPCWRIKDGAVLTKGEKAVLKVVQSLWPNGYGNERHINSKIRKALPPEDAVADTTVKSARRKIEFG